MLVVLRLVWTGVCLFGAMVFAGAVYGLVGEPWSLLACIGSIFIWLVGVGILTAIFRK